MPNGNYTSSLREMLPESFFILHDADPFNGCPQKGPIDISPTVHRCLGKWFMIGKEDVVSNWFRCLTWPIFIGV